jgi:hypothetical protein
MRHRLMSGLPPYLRHALVCVVAVALVALIPAGAFAAVAVTGVQVTPSTTVAGGHPNLTVGADLAANPASDDARDLTLRLSSGLLGNPNASPACSQSAFAADTCPGASRVGSVTVHATDIPFIGSMTSGGDVYLVAPGGGEVARLGVWVRPQAFGWPVEKFSFGAPVVLHAESDYGLEVTLRDLPRNVRELVFGVQASLRLTRVELTLFANGANAPFVTNPTTCVPATVTVTATSYDEPGTSTAAGGFTPTDCSTQPFATSLAASLETSRTDTPSGVNVTLGVSGAETPRRSAHVRTATVALPQGMTLNPAAAEGLAACTDAELGAGGNAPPACPPASVIGTAEFTTPILGSFAGNVYFGAPADGAPYRLFVDVPIPGARIKLAGPVHLDPATGRVTAAFDVLPQVPFTAFTLRFHGGSRGVFVTPATCGSNVFESTLVPWSRLTGPTPADAHPGAAVATTYDGAGAACPAALGFTPALAASLSDTAAGASGALTVRIERPDRDARLSTVHASLPPGLAGALGLAGLTRCGDAAAAAGTCPDSSRVGSVRSTIGSGATPPTIAGSVFVTNGRVGDLAGLSIHLPGRLGPVAVGDVIVGARLVLRPADAGIDVITDPIPQMKGGVPIAVRALELALDRPGFMRNPTRCGDHPVTARIESTAGDVAQAAANVTVTGCDRLAFGPQLSGTIGPVGSSPVGAVAPVTVAIKVPDGHATMRRVVTTLPRALEPNLRALARACPAEQADAGTCPASSIAGKAQAVSPLLAEPLTGPVRLVKGTGAFPLLRVELGGPLALTLTGTVGLTASGAATTTFDAIPDLLLSRFELSLDGGQDGLLFASPRTCSSAAQLYGAAEFMAHTGATATDESAFAVKGCSGGAGGDAGEGTQAGGVSGPLAGRPNANLHLHWRRRAGQLTATVWAPRGRKLSMTSIALPSGLCVRGTRGARAYGDGKRLGAGVVKASRCRLTVRSAKPAGRLTLVMPGLQAKGKLARALSRPKSRRRLKLAFRVVASGSTLRVTVRPT